MKTVFVSGCVGTVAIFTINELLKKGYTVIGVDDCSCNPYERRDEIIQSTNFHMYDSKFYNEEQLFQQYKIDAILHLASKTVASESFKDPETYCNVNIGYTAKLLKLAQQYDVKRFVFESSSAVYGNDNVPPNKESDKIDPNSIYGITKYASEMLVNNYHKQYGLETINLRCYNIFAPIHYHNLNSIIPTFALKILHNEKITLHNMGRPKRQFVHIDNIVHANVLALETTNEDCYGQSFNISTTDVPMSLLDLVKMLYRELNMEENYILSEYVSDGDILLNWGHIRQATDVLGYRVQKNMYDGIMDYLHWFKTEYMR